MVTIILVAISVIGLIVSFFVSKEKSIKSLKNAKNLAVSIFPDIFGVLLIISLLLALIPDEMLKNLLGNENKALSTMSGALIGTITIIPGFIAFPLASSLFKIGAHLMAIAAFITTLTMVGVATLPIEIKYFGKKFAFYRNVFSFMLAIVIAILIGVII